MSVKFNYEEVKQYFEDNRCELISNDYKGANVLLEYKCICGNESKIRFSDFKKGKRCQKCKSLKLRKCFQLSFEEVKQYFEDQGCELLSTEYTNAHIILDYICSCGNKSKTNFNSFKNGRRCKQCGIKKMKESQKIPFEEVKQYFKDQGCELLANEYINNCTPMFYVCSCGNESKICFNNFKQGRRCMKCSGNEQPTFEEVKQYFKDQGCELLANEYINNCTPMLYVCSCGNKSKIIWAVFKNERRCKQCGIKKMKESQKIPFEEVKQYFKDQECELLINEYENSQTLMSYICNCGNESKICFNHFRNGKRCKKCGIKKMQDTQKLPFEEVKQYFEDQGCELLSTEYFNNSSLLYYICNCGNKSKISFANFKKGKRCNKCKPRSKGEVKICQLFDSQNILYNTEIAIKEIGNKRYDFQVNDSFIEYHGKQHYCPFNFNSEKNFASRYCLLNCIERDQIKIDYCKNNQIPLLIIPFWEFSRIEFIIEQFLNGEKIEIYDPPKIVLKYNNLRQRMRDHLKIESSEFLGGVI